MPAPPIFDESNASTLDTPEGPILYWALLDEQYGENFGDNANLTTVNVAVYWDDAATFKTYALGTTKPNPGGSYLYRFPPLECQFASKQYLTDLVKTGIHSGVSSAGAPQYWEPGVLYDNWFSFDDTYARVIYRATFRNLPYLVLPDGNVSGGLAGTEMQRYCSRRYREVPRERKVPSFGFEIYDPANPGVMAPDPRVVPIGEVGFVPYNEEEIYLTWHRVPWDWVPWTAIEDSELTINDDDWDYEPVLSSTGGPTTYARGWYGKGTVRFDGLFGDLEPYRDGSGVWLCDIPYLFKHNANGWNYAPRNNGTWSPIRVRDTNPPQPLYLDSDFWQLFVPEPPS